jgi:hypothetical protein
MWRVLVSMFISFGVDKMCELLASERSRAAL